MSSSGNFSSDIYPGSRVAPPVHEIEPQLSHALSVWWLIIWRGLLGGLLIGFVVGFIVGFVMAIGGMNKDYIGITSALASLPFTISWQILVVRMALRKTYNSFRIAIIHR